MNTRGPRATWIIGEAFPTKNRLNKALNIYIFKNHYLPFEKRMALHLYKFASPSLKVRMYCAKIGSACRGKLCITIVLKQRGLSLRLNKSESHSTRMLCAKFHQNWPLVLEEILKQEAHWPHCTPGESINTFVQIYD